MKGRRVWLVVAVLVVGACSGPSLEELTESADDLAIPAGWELVAEELAGSPCPDPVENCPRVDRTYRVPVDTDFGVVVSGLFEAAGFEVWDSPGARCGANPETGCNAGAREGDVSLRATVIEAGNEAYTVTLRVSEYVGP